MGVRTGGFRRFSRENRFNPLCQGRMCHVRPTMGSTAVVVEFPMSGRRRLRDSTAKGIFCRKPEEIHYGNISFPSDSFSSVKVEPGYFLSRLLV